MLLLGSKLLNPRNVFSLRSISTLHRDQNFDATHLGTDRNVDLSHFSGEEVL